MATGTFTDNALCMKTLKERIRAEKLFKLDKSNATSVGKTAVKPYLCIL